MSIRITGMYSGLDTESIITQLASAQSIKKNNMVKAQTKVSWKQDAWKALNTKIYNFYTNVLDNMRWQSSYMKKTTKVSNSNAVSIVSSSTAPNSVQSMKITQLAKQAYMTGGSVAQKDADTGYTKQFSQYSTLKDMGFSGEGSFRVNVGGKATDITISEDMRISDVVSKLESAGLTANFDSKQQRFYLSAKTSGADANFTITGNDASGRELLSTLGLVSFDKNSGEYKEYEKWKNYGTDATARAEAEKAEVEKLIAAKKASTDALTAANEELQKRLEEYLKANIQEEDGQPQTYKYHLADGTEITADSIKDVDLMAYADSLYNQLFGVEAQLKDEYGDPMYVQEVDANGRPVYEQLKDAGENPVFTPKLDEEGNAITDADGNPVLEPVYVQRKDKDGNPLVDADGNPVYQPVYKKDDDDNPIPVMGREQSPSLRKDLEDANNALKEAQEKLDKLKKDGASDADIEAAQQAVTDRTEDVDNAQSAYNDMLELHSYVRAIANTQKAIADNNNTINDNKDYYTVAADNTLYAKPKAAQEVKDYFDTKIAEADEYLKEAEKYQSLSDEEKKKYALKTDGQDAEISLNGVIYTNSTNTFEINGLTITAQQETGDEDITLTTTEDTDGIYDMIKNFITEYNKLINEMSALYNADSSKGYEPLLSEEKADLSDSEIEEWEKKIKDSILRNDSTLRSVSDGMKDIMLRGATVDGKTMYLSNFGINTLGYFKSADNEKFAYHINGDKDDSTVSQEDDDLRAMIASDPDTVMKFFSSLANNLHDELADKMKSVEGVSSAFTVYNDKTLQKEYDDYKDKIKKEEDKLNDLMDRWYQKFSVMETALAKLQSKNNAVMGMFGN